MTDANRFEPWELVWGAEHIQRFWNWWGRNPTLSRLYFSRLVGDSILDEIGHYFHLGGTVVDLGSGLGYMLDNLLRRGIDTLAIDSSTESVELLTQRFIGQSHFLGARASPIEAMMVDDAFANIVLLIETIEHLDDYVLQRVLPEVWRILKREGFIVVTTPNEENLAAHQTMCPNCGCVFHTVQHVRSLSKYTLQQLMRSAGFTEVVCRPTLFSAHHKSLRPLQRLKYKLKGDPFPHLLYIGRKL